MRERSEHVYLAVEVSDTTLAYDRDFKAPLYAANGIPEYWIVNVQAGTIIVYRDPGADGYQTMFTVSGDETVSPLALPGVTRPIGSHHLIRQVFQDIEDIFFSIGFSVVEGPEIETPYYNFEALNIPEFHPVRDDMDTFYIDLPKGAPTPLLLRTHTSPMQIRTMEKQEPPVRVIVPGKVYRRDKLGAGTEIAGPALIQEHGTTTVLFEHDNCRVADSGELIIVVGDVR